MRPGLASLEPTVGVCLVDGARVEGLAGLLEAQEAAFDSLYAGEAGLELAEVAPYLVTAAAGSPFTEWFFGTAWGQSAGVAIVSDAEPEALRTHFRRFLMVATESGQTLYFRFYDPRVLRIFLPTCDAEQLATFFGPVTAFLVEDEDPDRAIRFSLADGTLATETIELTAAPRVRVQWKGRH
ncbi:MAG: DUF4123 domain-containing protein [Gemmatimonadales bacterium]